MLGALVIVFREVLEAGLIIGIVLAATRGAPGRGAWIAARRARRRGSAPASSPCSPKPSPTRSKAPARNCSTPRVLGAAVLMLMWHNAWMARHGRELAAEMTAVGAAVTAGQRPMTALAVVVGLAVLREGSEVVLFLYGIVATGTSASALFIGGVLGLAAGAAFTALTYYGLHQHSGPAHFHGDDRAHCVAGRGHGGAGGAVPRCRRHDPRAGADGCGTVRAGCRRTASSAACCTRSSAIPTGRPSCSSWPISGPSRRWRRSRGRWAVRARPSENGRRFARSRRWPERLCRLLRIVGRRCLRPGARPRKPRRAPCRCTLSSARAGPRGERLPCSQLRTVSTGTPMRAANSACVSLVRARTPAGIGRVRRPARPVAAWLPVAGSRGAACARIASSRVESACSCPSGRISTIRPSAFSLTRIMVRKAYVIP